MLYWKPFHQVRILLHLLYYLENYKQILVLLCLLYLVSILSLGLQLQLLPLELLFLFGQLLFLPLLLTLLHEDFFL